MSIPHFRISTYTDENTEAALDREEVIDEALLFIKIQECIDKFESILGCMSYEYSKGYVVRRNNTFFRFHHDDNRIFIFDLNGDPIYEEVESYPDDFCYDCNRDIYKEKDHIYYLVKDILSCGSVKDFQILFGEKVY